MRVDLPIPPTAPAVDPAAPPAEGPPALHPRATRRHLWILAALTALSAFLCFTRMSFPPLLIDECLTYWRVCGSLTDLLDTLHNDAFMPLHYEAINWIGRGMPLGFGLRIVPGGIWLTPAVLRFFPSLAATAMTPTIYFLARQLFARRTALFAAAFMACSAYGLFYAHYAKMYAPTWTLATLSLACFLWWMRSDLRLAWLCWLAAGVAAAGVHVITLLLLPVAAIYFFAAGRFRLSRVFMLLAGIAVIALAPAVYYGVYNRWTQNSGGLVPGVVGNPEKSANWAASGLNWLDSVDDSPSAPVECLNAYLSGLDWKTLSDLAHPAPALERFSAAMIALAVVTYGAFILGAAPWPGVRRLRQKEPDLEPAWRNFLFLSLWLVLPVYGVFYCRSVPNFSSPLDWMKSLQAWLGPQWPVALAAAAALAVALAYFRIGAIVLGCLLILLSLAAIALSADNRWDWLKYLDVTPIRLGICAIAAATAFHFSAETLRQRALELARFLAVVAVILLLCGGACFAWRWMHDISMRKHPELPWQSIWNIRCVAIVYPAVWLAAAALVSRLPGKWLRLAVVVMICLYNLANGLAREYISTEAPVDRVMADVYAAQPGAQTRTYFDLPMFKSALFKPLVLYNACLAARLNPTPEEFRFGNTWPFQYGTEANVFVSHCVYRNTFDAVQLKRDLAVAPQVNRVIVWDARPARLFGVYSTGDSAAPALGDQWTLQSEQEITYRWYWTWGEEWIFRRQEFRRNN
jgi:4-amino-4-deoxy-L-arabinose transferase-like glycosyltransferase